MVQLVNPVPDTDIEISRGPCHSDPKIRGEGCLPKEFFWPFGPQFGPNIRGGGGGGPLPWIRHCNQV